MDEMFPGGGSLNYEAFGLEEERAVQLLSRLFVIVESGMFKAAFHNQEYTINTGLIEHIKFEKGLTLNEYGWLCFSLKELLALIKTKVASDQAGKIIKSNQDRIDREIMRGEVSLPNFMKGHES